MDIPGYAEALAWEERTREEAFLGVCAPIRGVQVQPLTLRRLTLLLRAESAFFLGRPFGAEDVALFLWICSPRFRPMDLDGRARFIAELSYGDALDDLPSAHVEISNYLDAAFNDAPAPSEKAGSHGKLPVTCFAAQLVHAIVRKYTGWRLDDVLDAPLACIYQLLRLIAQEHDPKAVFISRRSIKVRGEWLRSLQTALEALDAQPESAPPPA